MGAKFNIESGLQEAGRWRAALIVAYAVLPVMGHILLSHIPGYEGLSGTSLFSFIGAAWPNCLVLSIIVVTSLRRGYAPPDWGFALNRGALLSIGGVVLMTASLIYRAPLSSTSFSPLVVLLILGALTEELVFRVLLLNTLLAVLGGRGGRVHEAIVISALIFTAIHIPSQGAPGLFGVFTGALLFGYIYVWSRSIVFPFVIHTLVNTWAVSGFFGALVATVIYVVVSACGLKKAGLSSPALRRWPDSGK